MYLTLAQYVVYQQLKIEQRSSGLQIPLSKTLQHSHHNYSKWCRLSLSSTTVSGVFIYTRIDDKQLEPTPTNKLENDYEQYLKKVNQ